jgi:hypothetical protein
MAKKKELIDVIGKLRACIKPMIGHPENPFDETYLQELVDLADEHLDTGTVYYALFSEEVSNCGDYLVYGYNFTDKEKIRQDLIKNKNELDFDTDEEFDNFDSLSLEEMCEFLKFELEKDTQPF